MAQPVVVFQGQSEPSVPYTFTIGTLAFDLTASTVAFSMRPIGSAVLTVDHASATIVSPTGGTARYDWLTGDTAIAGTYSAWFTATLPSGKAQDTPEFEIEVASHALPGTYALVSLEELIDHLRFGNQIRKVTENDHQELRRKILAASSRCEQLTNRRFSVEIAATHTFRYDGDVQMDMGPFDLRTASAVLIDTDTAPYPYDSSQYRLEPRNAPHGVYTHLALPPYEAERAGSGANFWGPGGGPLGVGYAEFGREVTVTGDWGWTTIPEGIKEGVLVLAARNFLNPLAAQTVETAAVKYEFTRGTSATGGRASVGDDLPDEVASAWRPYVRAGF